MNEDKYKKITDKYSIKQLDFYRKLMIIIAIISFLLMIGVPILGFLNGIFCTYVASIYKKCIKIKTNKEQAYKYNVSNNLKIENESYNNKEMTNYKSKEQLFQEKKQISFHVAGVTFKNSDGTNRQTIIKKIANQYIVEPYGGISNKEMIELGITEVYYYDDAFNIKNILLKKSTYNDKLCIKVYFLTQENRELQIGTVPSNKINEVLSYMKKDNIVILAAIIGGKYKEIIFDELNEKEKVVINNGNNLGVKITIIEN